MRKAILFFGGTLKHKAWVAVYLMRIVGRLLWRAITHDLSKFGPSEAPFFIAVIDRLATSTYGSDEYRETLREIRPAIKHHNWANRHHPEHWINGIVSGGIQDMDLVDLTEMVCDWKAAAKRHRDGDVKKSLEVNRVRFGIPDMLVSIIGKSL